MPSGWDVYYVVFLSAFLALGIPVALGLFSFLFSRNKKSQSGSSPNQTQNMPLMHGQLGQRMNARFFQAVNATLVLITLILVLVPLTGMIQSGRDKSTILRGLLLVVSIAISASLGLLYSSRKGDLGWLSIHQKIKEREPK